MVDIEERRLIDVEQTSNYEADNQMQFDEDGSSALAARTRRPSCDRDNASGPRFVTDTSSIDGHGHGHEHVKLAGKHYFSIIAVGWIFAVSYFTNTMLNVAFELSWTQNSTIFGHIHHPHHLLLHFMDARLYLAITTSFLGVFTVPFLQKHLLQIFQTACIVVSLGGITILSHFLYALTSSPEVASNASDECPACGVLFASECLLGIGVPLGSAVGVAFLFRCTHSHIEVCIKLIGSLAICILVGEFLGFSCSFLFADREWLIAMGLVESTAVLPLLFGGALANLAADGIVEPNNAADDESNTTTSDSLEHRSATDEPAGVEQASPDEPGPSSAPQRPQSPAEAEEENYCEKLLAETEDLSSFMQWFDYRLPPLWALQLITLTMLLVLTVCVSVLYASIDLPRFMWSLIAEDIFDAIGEERHLARFYALVADGVAIGCCILSVGCNLRFVCCHGVDCQAKKLRIFAFLSFLCFLGMWAFEVSPWKTTHHIAWAVIIYAPLGALCMEAFLELLPTLIPAPCFTAGMLLSVGYRSAYFLGEKRVFPERLASGTWIALGTIVLSALGTWLLTLDCIYRRMDKSLDLALNLLKLYRLRQLGRLIAALRMMDILIRAEKLRHEETETAHSTDNEAKAGIGAEGDRLTGSTDTNKNGSYRCPECGRAGFPMKHNLLAHVRKYHGNQDRTGGLRREASSETLATLVEVHDEDTAREQN